jgi:hypothetical protein
LLVGLDRPETFWEALTGVDRLFLATGYTVAMVHESKTIVDAAADAGVSFRNGRMTYPNATWHEMVERYIEGGGVAWHTFTLTSSWTSYLLRLPSWMASCTGSWASRRSVGSHPKTLPRLQLRFLRMATNDMEATNTGFH